MKNLIYSSLLLVIFTIILSVPALGQDKQSDATWEETIGFIDKNLNYLAHLENYATNYIKLNDKGNIPNANIILSSTYRIDGRTYEERYTVPLQYIAEAKEAKHGSRKVLVIKLTGYYRKWETRRPSNGYEKNRNSNYMSFYISDSEMRPRLLKAFQHLAYLATEYREEQRKAAGDAF